MVKILQAATVGGVVAPGGIVAGVLPGVQVLCSIRTGQRSVLAYLADPFTRSLNVALRER